MDIPTALPGDLDRIAERLDGHAARLEACAVQARVATAVSWRGRAAELHRERVGGHADELATLAARVRESARRVRRLGQVAQSRLELVGTVDLTVGIMR